MSTQRCRLQIAARLILTAALAAPLGGGPAAYPIDGYEYTGMRRLALMQAIEEDRHPGGKQPWGALLPLAEVDLRLRDRPDFQLPPVDAEFTARIADLLGADVNRYAIAVLDLSDRDNPRYAEINGEERRNPGSVGKLVVLLGMFQALADLYPDDVDARLRVLRETQVTADDFIIRDGHTVRQYYPARNELIRRPLEIGDVGSLWDYLDWMASASSNAAASTLIKQIMLLRKFGRDYPVGDQAAGDFIDNAPREELRELLVAALQEPVRRNGLDLEKFRQGSFFTRRGNQRVPVGTSSHGTSREILRYALLMEQGKLVDAFSSREIKRLLYNTERRIRYASSPALREAAVYFKSGSLYRCAPEPGFVCKKYHGNKLNLMNSLAIVEAPARDPELFYIVALMSNVLRKNSAVDHQTLATQIHRLIQSMHPEPADEAAEGP